MGCAAITRLGLLCATACPDRRPIRGSLPIRSFDTANSDEGLMRPLSRAFMLVMKADPEARIHVPRGIQGNGE